MYQGLQYLQFQLFLTISYYQLNLELLLTSDDPSLNPSGKTSLRSKVVIETPGLSFVVVLLYYETKPPSRVSLPQGLTKSQPKTSPTHRSHGPFHMFFLVSSVEGIIHLIKLGHRTLSYTSPV